MYNIAAPTKDKNPANTIIEFNSTILNLLLKVITLFGWSVKIIYTFFQKCQIKLYLIILNIFPIYNKKYIFQARRSL